MSDEPASDLNIERVIGAFDEHGVKYVMVGGIAATIHGAKRATKDLDICPAWDRENLARLAGALRELGAVEKGTGLPPDVQGLHNMEATCWRSPFGDVDVLLGIPDKSQYERAQYKQLAEDAGALVIEFAKSSVIVASLKAIIRSKQVADREKDHEALPELIALDRGESAPDPGSPAAHAAGSTTPPAALPATGYKPPTPGRPGGLGR